MGTTDRSDVERDEHMRCASNDVEKPGHTHWCRLVKSHPGDHRCICARSWERVTR
jgi:uncharacterized protein (DUF2237 family)